MRIDFEVTPLARQQLLNLLTPRVPEPADAIRLGELFIDDMEAVFRQHHGMPPEAEWHDEPWRPAYWWLYTAGVWVLFRVRQRRTGLVRKPVRDVRVIGFDAAQPQGEPGPRQTRP